jgi:hypothetical protein
VAPEVHRIAYGQLRPDDARKTLETVEGDTIVPVGPPRGDYFISNRRSRKGDRPPGSSPNVRNHS